MAASSVSFCVDTLTYSPPAIEKAPAKIADKAEIKINQMFDVALATPITTPAMEMIPSLAPKTPALKIFKRSAKFLSSKFITPYLESF